MYLNDAFDREIDARERPERPIPSGREPAPPCSRLGLRLLLAGRAPRSAYPGGLALAGLARLVLAGVIVALRRLPQGESLEPGADGALPRARVPDGRRSPLAGGARPGSWLGAALLLSYLIGLTYVAKQENLNRWTAPLAARLPRRAVALRLGVSGAGAGSSSILALGSRLGGRASGSPARRGHPKAVVA